jgi:uncharacterized protein YkuJ
VTIDPPALNSQSVLNNTSHKTATLTPANYNFSANGVPIATVSYNANNNTATIKGSGYYAHTTPFTVTVSLN